MKRYILSGIIVLVAAISFAQPEIDSNTITVNNPTPVTYKLYPTDNMWSFLQLNTKTGQIWQLQYAIGDGYRFKRLLNVFPLVEKKNQVPGRFTLYETQNMWTFILLDQIDGRTWQVQWSLDPDKKGIIPIEY